MSAGSSRPDRRRASKGAARKAQTRARPAPTRRPAGRPHKTAAPRAAAARRRGGGFLNTLIVALLVVLGVMIVAFLLVVLRVFG